MVGIDPRTGRRWRNGRRIVTGGRVVDLPPVIAPEARAAKRYSPRCLSEDERVRLADLRREGRTMRDIAVGACIRPGHDRRDARPRPAHIAEAGATNIELLKGHIEAIPLPV